ncbi:hypothetical protein CPQ89_01060 [Ligilactobacillus murinus]|uniref:Uncharacterized protein n=1 Tax=Ligilactobacillus murinus TaxID=1622 RepID=A0ABN5MA14_9LACO|nr:hypothetical protein [Ligilactobacillus murinus]AWZ39723.1 hypothetical protein CPQ89_01060 [Ligilactobacillus murinus]HBV47787.1 hypothetical protein [Lactobacillus sp.]
MKSEFWNVAVAIFTIISPIVACWQVHNTKKISKLDMRLKNYKIIQDEKEKEVKKRFDKVDRSGKFIPYFVLKLNSKKIRLENGRYILPIQIVNVGKGTAVNVGLRKYDTDDFIITKEGKAYYVYDYLNYSYACEKDAITFEITTEEEKNINNIVQFKIVFSDLIGNWYEQEFSFIYDTIFVHGFSRDMESKRPKKIDEDFNDILGGIYSQV